MPPMVLLEIFITPGVPVPAKMPVNCAAVPAPVQSMLPVADWSPMVLAVVLPTLIEPVTAEIAVLMVEVVEVERERFFMVFPWMFEAVVVPTLILIPIQVHVNAPVAVQVPAASEVLPPMELVLTVKLFPEVLAMLMPMKPPELPVKVRVPVWYRLLPVIDQSVLPVETRIPFATLVVAMKKLKILLFEIVTLLLFSAAAVVPLA
jgi:hypothetical protein